MASPIETAALVALLGSAKRPWAELADAIEDLGGALPVLEAELSLLAQQHAEEQLAALQRWHAEGIRTVTILDPDYPQNLRAVHDRPPLIFMRGALGAGDWRSVAVVGTRQPSERGREAARSIATALIDAGYVVVSGLARGIDTLAHRAALERGGRTIAVLGTGLHHAYPPENLGLQERIAEHGALLSVFSPETGPGRDTFPLRNGVTSGISLATVIVEASRTSGTRILARRALAHGRPLFLLEDLLIQEWARELAGRPGVHTIDSAGQAVETLERLTATETLTE